MIAPIIREAPGTAKRPGRAHLSPYGIRVFCGRWAASSWPVVNEPTRPLCRQCVAAAPKYGFDVPDAPEEPTPAANEETTP